MLWPDRDCLDFCPVSYLLLYLYKTKLTKGYIFPLPAYLEQICATDGMPEEAETNISYDTFERTLKSLCVSLFGSGQHWGTHTCRKSLYLFAVWGGGCDTDIMQSAHHKSIKNALKYKKDAATLLEIWKLSEDNFGLLAPKWRAIHIQNLQLARDLTI
jgi:hypothetical protein